MGLNLRWERAVLGGLCQEALGLCHVSMELWGEQRAAEGARYAPEAMCACAWGAGSDVVMFVSDMLVN